MGTYVPMTSHGSALTRYRKALAGGNPNIAWAAALETEYLDLTDSLGLVLLLAGSADQRFSAAAGRWLGRLALERELGLEETLTAACALVTLRSDPRSQEARSALEQLVEA